MNRLLTFLLLMVGLGTQAATITNLAFTNYDGTLLTNDMVITPVRQPLFIDGSYSVAGPSTRFGVSNGTASRYMLAGNYELKIYDPSQLLPSIQPVLFAVPNTSGTYSLWSPGIRITGGSSFVYNFITVTNTYGSNVSGSVSQSTHSTNADYVTASILTNQTYGSNMIGALAQSTHATNADNAVYGTNSFYVLTPTLTNQAYSSNLLGAAAQATHSTNADFITTAVITNKAYTSNLLGVAILEASHTTNADFIITALITNQAYASNLVGAVGQATHSTNADYVSGILTNQHYASNLVGAAAQATHSTNADFITTATVTNQLYGSNILGAAGQATHATNADIASFVSPTTLTNQVYGSNIVGSVPITAQSATYVLTATLTNQVYSSNALGAIAQATHSTNADYVSGTLTNASYASNLVGAAAQATHATNADYIGTATITNSVYSSNLVGAAGQATHATNADLATFVTTGTLTNLVYGSNVTGAVTATANAAQFITTATITNAYYSSNAVGAISQATHATNADFITTGTITNLHYASNLVGAAAQATHSTNADFVTTATLTNQTYASNIIGSVAGVTTSVASYVTNFPLTNTLYSSNAIGAIAQSTHATNADWITAATITNRVYGTNLVGGFVGPIIMSDLSTPATAIQFGQDSPLALMFYDDDFNRFYLKSGINFLFNGVEVTNIVATNVIGIVTNAWRASLATNVLFITNVFLTNQIYASNIVGAVASGVNLAAYVTNSPLTNTLYGSNIIGAVVQNTNGFATNLYQRFNKTTTNQIISGDYKFVNSAGVTYANFQGASILDLPNGFSGPVAGGQITSGTIDASHLGTGIQDPTNFLRADGAFAQVASASISGPITNTFYGVGTLSNSLMVNATNLWAGTPPVEGRMIMTTNQNNGSANPVLDFVIGHTNRGMYWNFSDSPGDGSYGGIYLDTVHDTGALPGSASQYEFQLSSPHNIAIGAGFVNGGAGHYQIGIGTVDGTHAPWWYFNTATPVTPGNDYNGFSTWAGFRSFFSDHAGGQIPRYAGMFSRATSNSFTLEITGSPNTNFGDMFQSSDTWNPNTTIPRYRAIFEFGSNQNLISFSVPTNLYIGGNSYFTNSATFLDTFRLGSDGAYITAFQSLAALFIGANFSHAVSLQIGDGGGNTIANFGGGSSYEGNYVKKYGLAINKNGTFTPAVNSECVSSNALEIYGNATVISNAYVGWTFNQASNALANWPTVPMSRGAFAFVNSNGFPYMLLSTNGTGGGSSTWTGTNKIGW